MAKSYVLHEKRYYQTSGNCFHNMNDALFYMKEMISKACNIEKELAFISSNNLPSPKYRRSVCEYLYTFFYKKKFPSLNVIDYSDYKGEDHTFDIDDFYYYDEQFEITEYDEKLGFIFYVGKDGMHLSFLNGLGTMIAFKRNNIEASFVFEAWEKDRPAIEIRIIESNDKLPPKLIGSFYPVLLLEELLNGTKTPIKSDSNNNALIRIMEQKLFDKMNKDVILPSKLTFTERVIKDYLKQIEKMGYEIKSDGKDYYVPPFICKSDANLIINAIRNSNLLKEVKNQLIDRFIKISGYNRFAKNELEESPIHKPSSTSWSKGDYSLIVYHMLKLLSKPVLVTSKKKESIFELIRINYGFEKMPKRQTIENEINSMIAIGLPIKRVSGGVVFNAEDKLSPKEKEAIIECIKNNNNLSINKKHLIAKIDEKI